MIKFKFDIAKHVRIPSLMRSGYIIECKYVKDDKCKIHIKYDIMLTDGMVLTNIPEPHLEFVEKKVLKTDSNIKNFSIFKEECPNNSFGKCLHYYKGCDKIEGEIDCEEINCPHYHFYKISQK